MCLCYLVWLHNLIYVVQYKLSRCPLWWLINKKLVVKGSRMTTRDGRLIARRKRLKKSNAKRLNVSPDALGWINGNLYLLGSPNTLVAGVPSASKPKSVEEERPSWRSRYR